MPKQVSAEEQARRLGLVASILIDIARRHAAEAAKSTAQPLTTSEGNRA